MSDDTCNPATVLRVLAGLEPLRRPASHVEDFPPRYAVEDGPGARTRVELAVRVLVWTERPTIIVADRL